MQNVEYINKKVPKMSPNALQCVVLHGWVSKNEPQCVVLHGSLVVSRRLVECEANRPRHYDPSNYTPPLQCALMYICMVGCHVRYGETQQYIQWGYKLGVATHYDPRVKRTKGVIMIIRLQLLSVSCF